MSDVVFILVVGTFVSAIVYVMLMGFIGERREFRRAEEENEKRQQWRKLEMDIEILKRYGRDGRADAAWLRGHKKLAEDPDRWLEL